MKSIVIIIPYFGPFPKQFNFWLQSAYLNPSIDFILITDQVISNKENVKIVSMTFNELKCFMRDKFEFPLSLTNPYKLCDFRPAYGYIFEKYIKKYDFWGFGDIDLVYGNIRTFYTDEILDNYKIISGQGHLTLYENSEFCNTFFRTKYPGFQFYQDSFTKQQNTVFDEYLHAGMSDLWKHLYPNLIYNQRPFDDILVPRLSLNFISVFNPYVSKNLVFEYFNGNLFRIFTNEKNEIIKEPTLYAHFQQRKFMKVQTSNLRHYLIVPNKFIDHRLITIAEIHEWGKPRNFNRYLLNFKNRVVRRLKIIWSTIFSSKNA